MGFFCPKLPFYENTTSLKTRPSLAPFLNAWLAAPEVAILPHHFMISHILEVVDNYDPTTEVVLLLESFDQGMFFYFKNLPIIPCPEN